MTRFHDLGFSIASANCIARDWPTFDAAELGLGPRQIEDVTEYTHDLTARTGYHSARITWVADRQEQDAWLRYGVGRDVRVYGPEGGLCWEGCVNTVMVTAAGLNYSAGPLVEIANRVVVVYAPLDITTDPPTTGAERETPAVDNADSQERFGYWEKVYSAGPCYDGGTPALPQQIANVILRDNAFPHTTQTLTPGQASQLAITIECVGYWAWLQAYVFNDATAGSRTVTDKLGDVLGADPNQIIYGVGTVSPHVETNNALVARTDRDNRTAWEIVQGLTTGGDGVLYRPWVFGIYDNRLPWFYAMPASAADEDHGGYQYSLADPAQAIVRYQGQGGVDPWVLRPGRWMFVPDVLSGEPEPRDFQAIRQDPRYLFIERVAYTVPFGMEINGARLDRLPQLLQLKALGGI